MKYCLIVDDSKVIRTVARKILEELEFETDEAADGKLALAGCQRKMPDVILLDWNMPVMDGISFRQKRRDRSASAAPKVKFGDTEKDSEHIQEAIDDGANEYIMKPFDSEFIQAKFALVGLL